MWFYHSQGRGSGQLDLVQWHSVVGPTADAGSARVVIVIMTERATKQDFTEPLLGHQANTRGF